MAEPNDTANNNAVDNQEDPIKNIKSEFNRKLDNYGEKLNQVSTMNQKILEQLENFSKPKQVPVSQDDTADLGDLIYNDPKKALSIMEERAAKKARETIEKQLQVRDAYQKKQTSVLSKIVADYPEINNSDHELTKRTVAILNEMPEQEKQDPNTYRLAVYEAAAELGIKPKKNRKESDVDDFVMSGGDGGGRRVKKSQPVEDEGMLEFASMMGLDVSKKEVRERLQKRGDRPWSKYR